MHEFSADTKPFSIKVLSICRGGGGLDTNGWLHLNIQSSTSITNRNVPEGHLFIFFVSGRIVGYLVLLQIYYFLHLIVVPFPLAHNHRQIE